MTLPSDLIPLVDGDIIRYELGYAAETGWKKVTGTEDLPPFDYVEDLLLQRLTTIQANCNTTKTPEIYLTEGKSFRDAIAQTKPYKGTRKAAKPWHYSNLTVYLRDVLGCNVISGIEADDALAIRHSGSNGTTILCSRDKDLRQVPGWFYSWELGKQPSFGPIEISQAGYLSLSEDHKKLTGTGLAFFYAQVLMGDPVDNIPGCPDIGPVQAHAMLDGKSPDEQLAAVRDAYYDYYAEEYMERLTEQGQLCWMLRKPGQVWEIGMIN